MRKMKNSEVAWIGEIPAEWKACKMLYVLRGKITDGPHETPELVSDGIPFVSVDSLNDSERVDFSNVKKFISEALYREYAKKAVLEPGDILFTKAATIGKTAIVGNEKFMVWSPIAIIKCGDAILNKYLYYVLNTKELIIAVSLSGTYNTQINVGMRALEAASIPLPALAEQQLIAKFLDSKCSQVDVLIRNVREQVEKLKEYKRSLITETVMKGIKSNTGIKVSGVDYIGDVNERYEITTIGSLFRIKKDILGREPEQVLSITQNGIKIKDTESNMGQNAASYAHYQIVNVGDFAMNHMDLITGGVDISKFEGVTSPDYRVFVLNDKDMNPNYFLRVFQAYYKNRTFFGFGQGVANLGRWRLPASNWSKIQIPVPPVEEQNAIVEFLEKKCNQIDQLIVIKQKKIEKLEQYKKSLIYEYVTGKKEVS